MIDFDILNPPHECKYVFDSTVQKMFKGPFFSWYFINEETKECTKIQESIKYAIEYVNKNGPYDGILGFSQGTVIARILLKRDEFKSPMEELKHRFKFGIIISGILNPEMKYIEPYTKDVFKLFLEYS